MGLRNFFFKTAKHQALNIKKQITFGSLTLKLYHVDFTATAITANIEAFDSDGNLVWTAQKPLYHSPYWDMNTDEINKVLDAEDGSGQHYTIDLSNGHIIDSKLIK